MLEKHSTDVSRLALIRQWSMAGAPGDLDGRFRTAPDIQAAVAELNEEPRTQLPPPAQAPLLMKPAGEDDWQLLVSDAA